MHVAYIHQHFTSRKGASGTRSYEMGLRLLAAGHQVTMVCGRGEKGPWANETFDGPVKEVDCEGIRVFCVNEFYANKMSFSRRWRAFQAFAGKARRIVSGLDADLVFATSTPLTVGVPGLKAARKLGVPFVFEVRDLWPELPIAMGIVRNPLLKWYLRSMERRIYRAATRIVALAPGIKAGICATGYPEDRVEMIPNSCDLDLFRPDGGCELDERFGEPGDFRLAFTGAHGLANGLDAVLDAAGELKRRGVKGVRFVFIGGGGQKPRLVQRSRDEGLEELTCWVDAMPKDELAKVLPSMDVGMMVLKNVPAFYEGTSPNKFFDFIACGLPVLNNYPGWVGRHIEEHRCGTVVPPDDPKAFADAVMDLRQRRTELPEMGRRARRLAETVFSRDLLAEKFVRVLEEAHAEGR